MNKVLKDKIVATLGSDLVSFSTSDLYTHSHDESSHQGMKPDLVCFPKTKTEVQKIIAFASDNQIPITAFGAGTGLEGQVIPVEAGISIDFSQMNQVVNYSAKDLQVTVQPGITRKALNKIINRDGLEFPIDPGADASIGGMIGTNASGTTAVRYGAMKHQVLALEIVLSNGRIIHTGSKAMKSASGYQLNELFIGAEGTLGIVTEITLKLHGILEKTIASRATFKNISDCIKVAEIVLKSGLSIRRMELIDKVSMEKINRYMQTSYPEAHTIFFEIGDVRESALRHQTRLTDLLDSSAALSYEVANTNEEASALWQARHEISYAFRHQKGKAVIGTDICVPISQLEKMVILSRTLLDEFSLEGGIIGHIGDGNFHTLIVYDKNNLSEKNKAENLHKQLVLAAIDCGGTCTGEHGVGLGKRAFQSQEHGESLQVMKQIKNLLDPHNLFNPGKIFE